MKKNFSLVKDKKTGLSLSPFSKESIEKTTKLKDNTTKNNLKIPSNKKFKSQTKYKLLKEVKKTKKQVLDELKLEKKNKKR